MKYEPLPDNSAAEPLPRPDYHGNPLPSFPGTYPQPSPCPFLHVNVSHGQPYDGWYKRCNCSNGTWVDCVDLPANESSYPYLPGQDEPDDSNDAEKPAAFHQDSRKPSCSGEDCDCDTLSVGDLAATAACWRVMTECAPSPNFPSFLANDNFCPGLDVGICTEVSAEKLAGSDMQECASAIGNGTALCSAEQARAIFDATVEMICQPLDEDVEDVNDASEETLPGLGKAVELDGPSSNAE